MLTNWETVSKSIKRLKELENKIESGEIDNLTKKEKLNVERSKEKLELNLGGIKNMPDLPDAIFVIDINKEAIAVQEANKLNIPVIAICDTNTDPNNIDYPVPGNDDAVRSISLYCDLIGSAILSGMEENLAESGVDIGNSEVNADEKIPNDQEIEALENAVEKEINQNQNGENFDSDLVDNSNSNEK
jgi:small subunit ribosomal protein S2